MENLTQTTAPTFESVWASLQENARQLKETERLFREQQKAEKERERKKRDRERKKREQERKKREQERKKREQERKKREQELSEMRQYFKERDEKKDKEWENYERRMKNMEKLTGSWSNNHGTFAEEYFYNAFLDGEQNFFGEKFDKIRNQVHHVTSKLEDEYDIVMYNHAAVAIIEAKYTAHVNDIPQTLKKAETFRILCPEYKDFKIYLGLASMSFYQDVEEKCTEQGIAIIKQVGDMVVINDAHLKVF